MKNVDHLSENCLLWLSDLSIYRCRLMKMQNRLANCKNTFTREGKFEVYIGLSQKLQNALKNLQAIEKKVIHFIKKGMNELYVPQLESWLLLEDEGSLYNNMMTANNLVLDLQKSFDESFRIQASTPFVSRNEASSKVVDMPAKKAAPLSKRV